MKLQSDFASSTLARCVLATGNQGKLREFTQLLGPLGWSVVDQASLGITPCPEPHNTFLENALEKARHAARLSGLAALADDSGICLPSLNGSPGVLSARFAQSIGYVDTAAAATDQQNNLALIEEVANKLKQISQNTSSQNSLNNLQQNLQQNLHLTAAQIRAAYYVCVLVFIRNADDPQPLVAQATWWGEWLDTPAGDGGFGYDPYFYLPREQCTVAQLSSERKNQLSHRAQAMQLLLLQLQQDPTLQGAGQ